MIKWSWCCVEVAILCHKFETQITPSKIHPQRLCNGFELDIIEALWFFDVAISVLPSHLLLNYHSWKHLIDQNLGDDHIVGVESNLLGQSKEGVVIFNFSKWQIKCRIILLIVDGESKIML